MKQKLILRLCIVLLISVLLLGAVAMAAGDSAMDPLVTLSYLNGEFSQSVLDQAKSMTQELENQMTQKLQSQGEMLAQAVANQSTQTTLSTGFSSVILAAGQSDLAPEGAEVLVLDGSLVASADMTDVTLGATIYAGDRLTVNHLYVCLAETTLTSYEGARFLRQ